MHSDVSRRTFLTGTAVLLSGSLIGTGLLLPTTAVANEAAGAVAVKVAQSSIAILKAARGGGPGITSLMRQQVAMLSAISLQLDVIDQRLQEIYREVQTLNQLVRGAPSETVRTFFSETLSGTFEDAAEIMRAYVRRRERFGIVNAETTYRREAAAILGQLRRARSPLLRDGSLALAPLIAASWLTEFQLMVSLADYDTFRIDSAAESYQAYFARTETILSNDITRLEEEAGQYRQRLARYGEYEGYHCFTDVTSSVTHSQGGGGREGSGSSYTHFYARGVRQRLSSQANDALNQRLAENAAFDDLRAAGVPVHEGFRVIPLRIWSVGSELEEFRRSVRDGTSWGTPAQHAAFSEARENARCEALKGDPRTFAAAENALLEPIETMRAKALALYSLRLCALEASASINNVLQRVSPPRV